jgi:dihydroflavonol-4-reductase
LKILLTGASGFVGSAVLRKLLAQGSDVRVLVREASNTANIADLPVEILHGDLNDKNTLKKAVQGVDGVFHVAADYRIWVPDEPAMMHTNLDGTRNLMLASMDAGVGRIVYTSSVATLGVSPDQQGGDEDTPSRFEDMIGPYKRSKFLAEEAVSALIRERDLPAVIVNPSTPIGPRDIKPTPTGRMIVEAAKGNMPGYVNTGLNIVHVDDVADGHLSAFDKGRIGERYILGGRNLSLKDILGMVAGVTGRAPPKWRLPHGVVLPIAYIAEWSAKLMGNSEPFVTVDGVKMSKKYMYFNSSKALDELGYAPRPAEQAISDAIRWFEENGYLAA